MSDTEVEQGAGPGRAFWIIAALALLWNLIGGLTFVQTIMLTPDDLAALSADERALYTDIPVFITAVYGLAVLGGIVGCVLLLMRRAWAVPVFAVSLMAIAVQMGHAVLLTEAVAVRGTAAVILPLVVTGIAVALLWYARAVRQRGWLR